MNLNGNTILITGGATGIGFGVADRLTKLGNIVMICRRRKDKLEEAKMKSPSLLTFIADISNDGGRKKLLEYAGREIPKLNVLINNAGIQGKIELTKGEDGLEKQTMRLISIFDPGFTW